MPNPEPQQKIDLRKKILDAQDLRSKTVDVPEWGVKVKINSLTASHRSRLIGRAMNRQTGDIDYEILYPLLVVHTVVDPDTGESVFTEDDLEALGGKSGAVMERLAQDAAEMSGMTEEANNALGEDSSPATPLMTASDELPST